MGLVLWFGMKMQGGFSEDGWYFRYVMPVISSAIFGYLYSTIAVEVAPRGKIIAGTVMVTILGLIAAISLFISWFAPATPIGEKIQMTVGSMATMVVAILTLVDANGQSARRKLTIQLIRRKNHESCRSL